MRFSTGAVGPLESWKFISFYVVITGILLCVFLQNLMEIRRLIPAITRNHFPVLVATVGLNLVASVITGLSSFSLILLTKSKFLDDF